MTTKFCHYYVTGSRLPKIGTLQYKILRSVSNNHLYYMQQISGVLRIYLLGMPDKNIYIQIKLNKLQVLRLDGDQIKYESSYYNSIIVSDKFLPIVFVTRTNCKNCSHVLLPSFRLHIRKIVLHR